MKGRYLLWLTYLLTVGACALPSGKLGTPTTALKHYQFSQLDSLMSREQRPLAVFLHADWCKYCKNMEQTTFQNQKVIELLNNRYYFIAFNGEQKEAVTFRNHLFQYQPTGSTTGTHELAIALGTIDGSLSYPAFIVLNSDYDIIFQHNAFLSAEAMSSVLRAL